MATLGFRNIARGLDLGLLTITVILVIVGLAALFSFSVNSNEAEYTVLTRQLIFAVVGFAGATILTRLDYRWFAGVHWVLYGVSLLMLILVLVFGSTFRGTTGWFEIGGFQLQPVEFVKVTMAVFLAKFFSDHADRLRSWRTIIISGVVAAVPAILIMLQPDFGSAAILILMWLGLLIILPVPRRTILAILGTLAIVSTVAWFTILAPYQKDRILTFVFPGRDVLGSGYNVRQAVTAIGSGQLFGRGLGLGPQSQLNFLPERHTDFIFASINEELGFVGGSTIIVLLALFFFRLRRLMLNARDNFSVLLVVGLALMFFVQVLINIGMNLGILPVTGIPLPFISYGGSSLIASLLAIGLLESMSVRQQIRL